MKDILCINTIQNNAPQKPTRIIMKAANRSLISYSTGIAIILSSILLGCTVGRIYEKEDIVYSTKRLELKLDYYEPYDNNTALVSMNQAIVKEISKNETTYKVYDTLILTSLGYKIDDKFFPCR